MRSFSAALRNCQRDAHVVCRYHVLQQCRGARGVHVVETSHYRHGEHCSLEWLFTFRHQRAYGHFVPPSSFAYPLEDCFIRSCYIRGLTLMLLTFVMLIVVVNSTARCQDGEPFKMLLLLYGVRFCLKVVVDVVTPLRDRCAYVRRFLDVCRT